MRYQTGVYLGSPLMTYHGMGYHNSRSSPVCPSLKVTSYAFLVTMFFVWSTLYVILSVSSNRSQGTAAPRPEIQVQQNLATKNCGGAACKESLGQYLERTNTCDILLENDFNASQFNESALIFCRKYLKQKDEFYRVRDEPVDKFNVKFLVDGAHICNDAVDIIVLIHSLHSHRANRDAIRQTWGGAAQTRAWPHVGDSSLQPNVRVVFVFGVHEKQKEEENLREENQQNKDLIQGDFRESYRNMTLKSLLGLHWVGTHCPSAKYLLKCDDDMFINIPSIWSTLESTNMTWSIMGPLNVGSRVYRSGKWKLTFDQYPFYFYPPYEAGSGYIINSDLVNPLRNLSDFVPKIFIDDVYITGILGKILGVQHVKRDGFAFWTSKAPQACDILNGTILTGTRVNPTLQLNLWNSIKSKAGCETLQVLQLIPDKKRVLELGKS